MAKAIDYVIYQYCSDPNTSPKSHLSECIAHDLIMRCYGNVEQYQNEIDRLETELAHREEDLIHADEKVFYRETTVKLDEDKIKKQAVREFAEKLKEKMELNGYRSPLHNRIIDNLITELYGVDE